MFLAVSWQSGPSPIGPSSVTAGNHFQILFKLRPFQGIRLDTLSLATKDPRPEIGSPDARRDQWEGNNISI
jgi:hypothetical protein